jgi:hypothetical protein
MTWLAKRTRWGKSEEQRLAWLRKALRRPEARLVLEHRKNGHQFVIEPAGLRVADTEAEALIRRKYVHVLDRGLFDTPQSWTSN